MQYAPAAGLAPYPARPSSQADEEITTIFVVGFPDDMSEREFQNMFIFSPGFEAATLKIPNQEDEGTGRKQIIGFAKFRSRLEALEARDILTGRKVDADKGCTLKAEIAKKNLHTKRGLSVDYSSNSSSYSYQTHVQHYNRRFAAPSPGPQPDARSDRMHSPDAYASNAVPLPRQHPASFELYGPAELGFLGQPQGYTDGTLRSMERSPYLMEKDSQATIGMSRSGSRLDAATLDELREDSQLDLLLGGPPRHPPERTRSFSYNILPAGLAPHHQHSSSGSYMISSHSAQSFGSSEELNMMHLHPAVQGLQTPSLAAPASTMQSGVSSPYLRTALNSSRPSEEDLKALFGGGGPGLAGNPR
ncbi:hypothetical protein DFJ74DRAFT_667269 [Hyaloraphidium curvatum]|nr:hypothetical protein DFJ74DRAFT_667269 [Hyaloraphidium curvatum]